MTYQESNALFNSSLKGLLKLTSSGCNSPVQFAGTNAIRMWLCLKTFKKSSALQPNSLEEDKNELKEENVLVCFEDIKDNDSGVVL